MQSIKSLYAEVVRGLGKDAPAQPPHKPGTRARRPSSQFLRPAAVQEATFLPEDKVPLLHLKRKIGNEWQYSSKLTSLYLDILKEIATSGVTFEHKNALMTGVGKGSIGIEIVKGLLAGGARVVVTTSRYSRSTCVSSLVSSFPLDQLLTRAFRPQRRVLPGDLPGGRRQGFLAHGRAVQPGIEAGR